MIPALPHKQPAFPDPQCASEDGLVAVGGDLSIERLLLAYRSGIFPWTVKPVSWWSPEPRGIFELETFQAPRRLAQLYRKCLYQPTPGLPTDSKQSTMQSFAAGEAKGRMGRDMVSTLGSAAAPATPEDAFTVTRNRAFREVMQGCAAPGRGRGRTWISREFIAAYTALHKAGHAHSVECWQGENLVGGIYGVSVGGLFAGESMFHRADNASKIALVHLIGHLRRRHWAQLRFHVPIICAGWQKPGR